MTENSPNNNMASLQAQYSGLTSALNMHVKRAEQLAVEMDLIEAEIIQANKVIEA